MVTSRERLNLHEEWLYEVTGMSLPPTAEAASLENYSAIQLFLQNARRVHPGFSPSENDWDCINRICQLVEGLPLALELASGWVRTLTCCEIANQIASSLDFLATSMPDRPPAPACAPPLTIPGACFRRRPPHPAQAVHLPRQLHPGGRPGCGGCASSHPGSDGRPLAAAPLGRRALRDGGDPAPFAYRYLTQAPEDHLSTESLHCEYYIGLLERQLPALVTPKQLQALEELRTDIENVRVAWNYAVKSEKWATLGKALEAYYLFCEVSGRTLEGYAVFNETLSAMRLAGPAVDPWGLSKLLTFQGWFAFRLGYHTEGINYLEESLEILQRMGDEQEVALALAMLANHHMLLGELGQAGHYLDDSLALFRSGRLPVNPKVLTNQTFALHTAGRYAARRKDDVLAKRYLQEALEICEQIGNYWATARLLDTLGQIALRRAAVRG
jgi:tetratricopeptide (TPR) repeat protein